MTKSYLMNIFIYQIITYLFLPFVFLRLIIRAIKQPNYLCTWDERLGFYSKKLIASLKNKNIIWFHCVSVGETNAAAPLIKILLNKYPKHHILITHSTPTGKDKTIINSSRIHRVYLPFDIKLSMNLFLDSFHPSVGLIFETEIWPVMTYQCQKKDIPLLLMNARLSEKSLNRYASIKNFSEEVCGKFKMICVQSQEDLRSFRKITKLKNIVITGNTKFDCPLSKNKDFPIKILKKNLKLAKQIILVAGSTRQGEEKIILDAIKNLDIENLTLILVPRHPQRFKEIERLIIKNKFSFATRSNMQKYNQAPQVLLGDSMGELLNYYDLADVVILGGSIKNFGAQNPIEPLSLGKKVIIGPSIFNFKDIIQKAEKRKLIFRYHEHKKLNSLIKQLVASKKNITHQQNIKYFLKNESGASKRLADIVSQYL